MNLNPKMEGFFQHLMQILKVKRVNSMYGKKMKYLRF